MKYGRIFSNEEEGDVVPLRKEFSKTYDWQAVVTMVLMPFLNIPEAEIWAKPTRYVLTMYGMFLMDQDAKEQEAKKRREDMEKEAARRRAKSS